jgi:Amino acid permease
MSTILGAMFLGVSVLTSFTHTVPFVSGTPTVVSEIGKLVYGDSPLGQVLFYLLQTATALILILAANTSFTGFPFLVSFVAEDSFLPRMLTVRGHRLVFSNGILLLAVASIALLMATGARVSALIPMYAIGVFTGFTMAGAGMARHHLSHRDDHWRKGVAVNVAAAVVCAVIVVVFAIAEFTEGGWVVVVVMPLIVFALVRMNREYRTEEAVLEEGAAIQACEAQILRRNVVVILIDRIDLATARAIQYARSLTPDDLRAVHFNIDHPRAEALMGRWQHLGLSRLPLDVIDCPDRRLTRASLELAAELADGETEVSILLPRRSYGKAWRHILHDQTADQIVEAVSQLSHVNATIVPFLVAPGIEKQLEAELVADHLAEAPRHTRTAGPPRKATPRPGGPDIPDTTPISELTWRTRTRIAGRVKSLRVQPWAQAQSLECVLIDNSGHAVTLVFLGRRSISGIRSGTLLVAEGMVGKHHNRLAIINPTYELLSATESDGD